MLSKPKKLKGYAIKRQKNTTNALRFSSPNEASFFVRERNKDVLSLTIFSDETSVVKIAPAIKTPQANLRFNFVETARVGIKLPFVSDKTTVCNINSIPNKNTQIIVQLAKISL